MGERNVKETSKRLGGGCCLSIQYAVGPDSVFVKPRCDLNGCPLNHFQWLPFSRNARAVRNDSACNGIWLPFKADPVESTLSLRSSKSSGPVFRASLPTKWEWLRDDQGDFRFQQDRLQPLRRNYDELLLGNASGFHPLRATTTVVRQLSLGWSKGVSAQSILPRTMHTEKHSSDRRLAHILLRLSGN